MPQRVIGHVQLGFEKTLVSPCFTRLIKRKRCDCWRKYVDFVFFVTLYLEFKGLSRYNSCLLMWQSSFIKRIPTDSPVFNGLSMVYYTVVSIESCTLQFTLTINHCYFWLYKYRWPILTAVKCGRQLNSSELIYFIIQLY